MKKFLLIVAAALLTTISANAQMYVGGTAGFAVNGGRFTGRIAPEFGYSFNSQVAVGGYLMLDGASGAFSWSFNPYCRWTFVHVNDFGIFLEGTFGIGTNKVGDASVTKWSIMAIPGVSYNVSDRWSVIGRVGGIGYDSIGGGGSFAININLQPMLGVACSL